MDRLELFRQGIKEGIKLGWQIFTAENLEDEEFERELILKATRGELDMVTKAVEFVPEGPEVAPEIVVIMKDGEIIEARSPDYKATLEVLDAGNQDHGKRIEEVRRDYSTIF